MAKVLVLFAHPALEKSRVHKLLIRGVKKLEGSVDNLMGNPSGGESEDQTNKNENRASNQNSASPNSQMKRKDSPQPKGQ